jgi:molybdenum cofactor cytidylyltransferase
MSTSIISGLQAVEEKSDAIMVVLADQPFIDSHIINHILEEFDKHSKGIVIPTYGGKQGHPVIISLKYKSELLALKGDVGARELISRHSEDVHVVTVDSHRITADIDTEEEYKLLR